MAGFGWEANRTGNKSKPTRRTTNRRREELGVGIRETRRFLTFAEIVRVFVRSSLSCETAGAACRGGLAEPAGEYVSLRTQMSLGCFAWRF
jgi:hypothetical protein